MPTKETESEVPATNVKAGFPGTTTSDVKPDSPGQQPTQPPEGEAKEGPSESAGIGPHGLDPAAKPLPGQPDPDDDVSSGEVKVVKETAPKTKK